MAWKWYLLSPAASSGSFLSCWRNSLAGATASWLLLPWMEAPGGLGAASPSSAWHACICPAHLRRGTVLLSNARCYYYFLLLAICSHTACRSYFHMGIGGLRK